MRGRKRARRATKISAGTVRGYTAFSNGQERWTMDASPVMPRRGACRGRRDKSKVIRSSVLSRAESSERCLECNGEGQNQRHHRASAHFGNDVGCVDGHSPNHARSEQHLLAKSQPELCRGCQLPCRDTLAENTRFRILDDPDEAGEAASFSRAALFVLEAWSAFPPDDVELSRCDRNHAPECVDSLPQCSPPMEDKRSWISRS